MLNQTAEYALRTVVLLAQQDPESLVSVGELADALGIPQNYLSKILHQLTRAGVLSSQRGRSGGFRLARPASAIPLAEVIAPFDPVSGERTCLLGRTACSDHRPCAAHDRWKSVGAAVTRFFHETTVEMLGRSGQAAVRPLSRAARR
jgi:Rrf2 family transcriptional regulator, iron-sulfur cluster assembly transcription factor